MGQLPHTTCCPTGTLDFSGGEAECLSATEATLQALQTRMSSHPLKVLVLYGSLRKDSKSRMLAIEVGRIMSRYGASVKVFDPTGLPIYSGDLDANDIPKAKELRDLVLWSESMVWISPEIHGNISSCFKNQIDWIPLSTGAVRPTQGKTVAVMQVEAGSQSFNTVNNLRVLARWMRMMCVPNQASIPRAYEMFDENGEMKASSNRDRVVDVVDELFKFSLLLRDQQPYLVTRYSEDKAKAKKNLEATTKPADATVLQSLKNPIILDVRSQSQIDEMKGGRAVEGSINVPMDKTTTRQDFARKLKEVGVLPLEDKDQGFITHCTSGCTKYAGRGAKGAAYLRDLGYANSHNGGNADNIRSILLLNNNS